jgi:hypothetical protein
LNGTALFNMEDFRMKTRMLIGSAALFVLAPASAEPITKTVSVDGPRYDGTRTTVRDRTAGTLTRETDVVRTRDGATASSNYSRTRTDAGVAISGSQTGFAGRTRSYEYDRTRTDSGSIVRGSVSRSDGNVTRSVDVTRAKGFARPQGIRSGVRGARRR